MMQTRNSARRSVSTMILCHYVGKTRVSLTIQDLPDLVLMQIFSHMPMQTLCRVARVCQRWMLLSYDSTLWKFVDLSQYKTLPTNTLLNLIHARFSPLLRFLDLSNCSISTQILCELTSTCANLEALRLSNCTWRTVEDSEVNFPRRLTYFDLRDFGGDYVLLGNLLDGLTVFKSLRYLGFGNCLSCDVAFSTFKTQVLTLEQLSVLEICDSEDVGDMFISEVAENMPLLRSICLRRCPKILGSTLQDVLDRLQNLTTLVLFRTGILDDYLMAPHWETLCIEELDLGFNDHITDRCLQNIIPRLHCLRYISLNNCGRGHAFNEEVANTIHVTNCWSSLETLSLQFCKRLEGNLLSLILNNCAVKHLSLRSSHHVSFHDVAQIVHFMPSMETLEVGALFSLDENGKDWDKLIIQLGKHCRVLKSLTLVKCFFAPRWKLRELKAAIRFFLTKCTRLRRVNVLYSESTICELFESVLSYRKYQDIKERICIASAVSEDAIPPTRSSLDNYLHKSYSMFCK